MAEPVRFLKTAEFLAENPAVRRKGLMARRSELGAIRLGRSFLWPENALQRASDATREKAQR